MVAGAYLLLVALGQLPSTQLQKLPTRGAIELSWSDAEDRIQGSVRPPEPRAGEPLEVSINVGSFEGKPFEGPVTLTLRKEGQLGGGEERIVAQGKVSWNATFHPLEEGTYELGVAFRSTRLKVTHVPLEVVSAKISRLHWWALLTAGALGALGLGLRALTRKEPAPPTPPA